MLTALAATWKQSLSPHTYYHRVRVLRQLLHTLEHFGAPDVTTLLPKPKKPGHRTVTATREQIRSLIAIAPVWMKLLINLWWQLALRFAEGASACPANFNAEQHTLRVRVKGGRTRTIPTTPDVEALFAAAGEIDGREDEPYTAILNGRPLTTESIRGHWHRICERADVKGVHPHDLRRTTATELYAVSKDLRAVQQFLGHESLASTVHYLAPLTEENLTDLHRLLNWHAGAKETLQ